MLTPDPEVLGFKYTTPARLIVSSPAAAILNVGIWLSLSVRLSVADVLSVLAPFLDCQVILRPPVSPGGNIGTTTGLEPTGSYTN